MTLQAHSESLSEPVQSTRLREFLWTLPQPLWAFGAMFAVASAISTDWTDSDVLTSIVMLSPIPLILIAERFAPRRRDWLLKGREFAEDVFWVGCAYLIWFPIYAEYYDSPISDAFTALRDASAIPITLAPESTLGLVAAALGALLTSEFIYYWLHRLQHRTMLFWRMHATHHHITKMSAARSDRTHPLEFAALNLGPAIMLALLGASGDVVAVFLAFRIPNVYLNHSNLPLRSGIYGWLFTTAEWHSLHHSLRREESDMNYGCTVILWDRVFGTFSGKPNVERVGNGTGEALSVLAQLTLPFRSNEAIKSL